MRKFRLRLGAALLAAMMAVAAFGSVAVHAQGGDDPCPRHVENLPGCV